jgi:hypothetical protein
MFVIKQKIGYERKISYLTDYKKPLDIRQPFYSENLRNIIVLLGQQRGRSSSSGRSIIFLLSMSSRLVLRTT